MPLKTHRFRIEDFLKDPADAVAYLQVVLEDGDNGEIRRALNNVARAQGISSLARSTGLSREALYKAFGENGNPTLTTLLAVFKALGVKMSVAPAMDRPLARPSNAKRGAPQREPAVAQPVSRKPMKGQRAKTASIPRAAAE